MPLYPEVRGRRARTLLGDALVLALLLLFAWLGKEVHDAVDRLSVLGEGVREVGDAVPVVGDPVAELGVRGEESVHRLATILGLLVFGLPSAVLLARTVPERLRQIRALTAAEQVLRADATLEQRRLVAMRAAFSLPYGVLLRHTRDPLGDLGAERYEPLVAAALEDAGLRAER